MILNVGIILLAYLLFKTVCFVINENEEIKFNIPKMMQRVSLGAMAFTLQVMFF